MEFEKPAAPTAAPAPDAPLSEQLVGEGKPFKTVEDLAKGKYEADKFIEQLKAENAQMLSKLSQAEQDSIQGSTISQVLEAVRALSNSGSPNDSAPSDEEPKGGNQPGLSEDDIRDLVSRTLKQNETAQKQEQNYNSVKTAFQKQYTDPDKARLQYKSVAASLGLEEKQLDEFARMNPKLVLRAAGLEQAFKSDQSSPSYLSNDKNSEAVEKGQAGGARDHNWWEEQRRAKGNAWYFSPKVQQAYWKDVNALGDSFLK